MYRSHWGCYWKSLQLWRSTVTGGSTVTCFSIFFQTYGFEHAYRTLSPLESAGLLRLQTSRSYNVLRKSLKLVVEDVQEQVNSDLLVLLACSDSFRRRGWVGKEGVETFSGIYCFYVVRVLVIIRNLVQFCCCCCRCCFCHIYPSPTENRVTP